MSNTFKYLDGENKEQSQENAAQSFLDDKLAKNRFTIEQEETLAANGGPTVGTSSGDDFLKQGEEAAKVDGGGSLAERYKAKFGSDAMSDLKAVGGDTNAANAIYTNIRSLDGDDFWAGQDLTALMGKAGHAETDGVRAGATAANGGMRVDATLTGGINYDSIQPALSEKGWDTDAVRQNGIYQLGSAMLAVDKGSNDGKDIQHSPEIEQAKDRVKTYEDNILSGKTSEDIYGSGSDYSFDAAKGAAGIGTPMNGDSGQQAAKATASFLDNKKSQVKDKYQFQAQS
jgi:hypothetical protein